MLVQSEDYLLTNFSDWLCHSPGGQIGQAEHEDGEEEKGRVAHRQTSEECREAIPELLVIGEIDTKIG